MILLGVRPASGDKELQEQMHKIICENKNKLNNVFNPENHFTFGPNNLTMVG